MLFVKTSRKHCILAQSPPALAHSNALFSWYLWVGTCGLLTLLGNKIQPIRLSNLVVLMTACGSLNYRLYYGLI